MRTRFSHQRFAPHSPRALVLLAAAMIVVLALAGCAPNAGAGQGGAATSTVATEPTTAPTMAAEATTEPTMEATEAATGEATEMATGEATMEATGEATMEATGEATMEATGEATSAAGGTPAAPTGPATVMVTDNPTFGEILTDDQGMTLYLYTKDTPNTSNCYDQCAVNWPPLLTDGEPVAGEGADESLFGTTTRTDGTTQVTYNGWPLYYWINDKAPGDATGQNVGGVWFVVSPEGEMIEGEGNTGGG